MFQRNLSPPNKKCTESKNTKNASLTMLLSEALLSETIHLMLLSAFSETIH